MRHASRAGRAVALTFDDGPGAGTAPILDRLAALDARATFFLVGARVASRPGLVTRIVADGHEIGSHSWSHSRPGRRLGRTWVELVRTSLALRRLTGARPRWFRPPYAGWSPALGWVARLAGMRMVTWDVDPRDWEIRDPVRVTERVLADTLPGSIVLLHEDGGDVAVEALPAIVEGLRARGLATVTLSSLLGGG